jgi:hypothetical protein
VQVEAQRRGGLDAVEVDHLAARPAVRLQLSPRLVDQAAQHAVAGAVQLPCSSTFSASGRRRSADAVVAAIVLAAQPAGASSCCSMRCRVGLGRPVASTRLLQRIQLSREAMCSSSANRRRVGVSPLIGPARDVRITFMCRTLSCSGNLNTRFRKQRFRLTPRASCRSLRQFRFSEHHPIFNPPLETTMSQPARSDQRQPVSGVHKMTPSEAFVETLVAQGVDTMFGIMGSAFMDAMDIFAPAGITPDPGGARAGRRPHGRRLCPRQRPPRRRHRPERPGISNA